MHRCVGHAKQALSTFRDSMPAQYVGSGKASCGSETLVQSGGLKPLRKAGEECGT